jgi:hypothetical protein
MKSNNQQDLYDLSIKEEKIIKNRTKDMNYTKFSKIREMEDLGSSDIHHFKECGNIV